MIINPHCLPSRMTINQIMASIMGKTCCAKNENIWRCFSFSRITLEKTTSKIHALCKELEECCYNYNGTETMMCVWNGKKT